MENTSQYKFEKKYNSLSFFWIFYNSSQWKYNNEYAKELLQDSQRNHFRRFPNSGS
jgi:nitrate reductase alpha subunit